MINSMKKAKTRDTKKSYKKLYKRVASAVTGNYISYWIKL